MNLRGSPEFPAVSRWLAAMEARPAYQRVRSDDQTLQVGGLPITTTCCIAFATLMIAIVRQLARRNVPQFLESWRLWTALFQIILQRGH